MEKLVLGSFLLTWAMIVILAVGIATKIDGLKPVVHKTIQANYLLSMSSEGLSVETFQNAQLRDYHLKHRNVTPEIMENIWAIPGVVKGFGKHPVGTYFYSDEYSVSVQKGKAFSWDEVEPEILKILDQIKP